MAETSSIGTSLLAATGASTGQFNVDELSEALANAETAGDVSRMEKDQKKTEAQLSAFGALKGALSVFKESIAGLTSFSSFQHKSGASSDENVFGVTVDSTAAVGSHAIEVSQLAQSQSLASLAFVSESDVVGAGELTFKFGRMPTAEQSGAFVGSSVTASSFTIGSTNDSLSVIVDGNEKTLTLSAGSYNSTQMAAEIQAQLDAHFGAGVATASFVTDHFEISAVSGGDVRLRSVGSSSEADLGLSAFFTQNANKPVPAAISIGATDTLQDVRDKINDANFGAQASIINDGSGYRLVLSMQEGGKNNSLEISVNDTGDSNHTDGSGLSRLAFNVDAVNMTQNIASRDAEFKIDGLSIRRDTNNIDDVLTGVTLDLNNVSSGSRVFSITQDVSAAEADVRSFIDGFNVLKSTINLYTNFDPETGESGALSGDFTASNIINQVRRITTENFADLSGPFQSMADLGVGTEIVMGTLSLDEEKLQEALASNFDNVVRLFSQSAESTDSLVLFEKSSDETKEGKYAVEISQLATQGTLSASTAVSSTLIDGSNNSLSLEVDGIFTGTISLTERDYGSTAALAAELQSKINGLDILSSKGISVSVVEKDGKYSITSSRYGSASKVKVVTGNESLGFASGASGTLGVDVAGTIGGVAATGSGQELTGTSSAEGLRLKISGTQIGSRGDVTFVRGYADKMTSLIDKMVESDSFLSVRENNLTSTLDDLSRIKENLDEKIETLIEKYRREYNMLNATLARFEDTSGFLESMLDSLLPQD